MNKFSYSNHETRWTFTATSEDQAYDFEAQNLKNNTKHAVGHGYFSKDGKTFVVGFKSLADSSIGFAVITDNKEDKIEVETKNPDGTKRWSGTLNKD
jgi:hypothetical protein